MPSLAQIKNPDRRGLLGARTHLVKFKACLRHDIAPASTLINLSLLTWQASKPWQRKDPQLTRDTRQGSLRLQRWPQRHLSPVPEGAGRVPQPSHVLRKYSSSHTADSRRCVAALPAALPADSPLGLSRPGPPGEGAPACLRLTTPLEGDLVARSGWAPRLGSAAVKGLGGDRSCWALGSEKKLCLACAGLPWSMPPRSSSVTGPHPLTAGAAWPPGAGSPGPGPASRNILCARPRPPAAPGAGAAGRPAPAAEARCDGGAGPGGRGGRGGARGRGGRAAAAGVAPAVLTPGAGAGLRVVV